MIAPQSGSVAIINCVDIEVTTQGLTQNQINQIEWYFDDGVNPPTIIHIGTIDYQPQQPGDYFVVFPFYPPGFQQSNIVTAEHYSGVSITQTGGTLLRNQYPTSSCYDPVNLVGNTNSNYNYNQLLWKRHGNGIIGGVTNLNDIDRPGLYTFEVDGPCGVDFDTITIFYDCELSSSCYSSTYINGGTITTSISLMDEIIGGTLTIEGSGVNVIFTHELNMLPGAQIIVKDNATITVDRAIFRSCGVWKGILIEDDGNINFFGAFGDNKIFDAEVAITKLGSGVLSNQFYVSNFIFEDNGLHIVCDQANFSLHNCLFKNITVGRNISTQSILNVLSNKTTDYPMIFSSNNELSNCSGITFDMRRAIDVIGSNSPPYISQFDPNVVTAMEILNSVPDQTLSSTHLDHINIYDGFLNGIVAKNSYGLQFVDVSFGSDFLLPITNYPLTSRHGHYRSNNGLIFSQCKNIHLTNSELIPETYGIQFYYNDQIPDPSNFGSISTSEFIHSKYTGGIAGFIIAPDVNPLTNTDQNLNTNDHPIDVDILCSEFHNSNYGIIGGGRKTDFEGIIYSTPYQDNLDPSLTFSNITSGWNIVWSENIDWSITPKMTYYSSNSSQYPNPLWDNGNSPTQSVILDNVLVLNNNYDLNNIDPAPFYSNSGSNYGIYCNNNSNFMLAQTKDVIKNNLNDFSIYPNPTYSKINLNLGNFQGISFITITDFTGKTVNEFYSYDNVMELNIEHLRAGIYLVTLKQENQKIVKKLIKY